MRIAVVGVFIVFAAMTASGQCDPNAVFNNKTTNAVCIEVDGAIRYIYANALPDHETGTFPNPRNPNAISAQRITLTVCSEPRVANEAQWLDQGAGQCPFWVFGVALNGIEFDPIANEFFRNPNTGQLNRAWNQNALSDNIDLGLDMNDAHVQPTGKYHYHGDPRNYIAKLGIAPSAHSPIIGYAADGFPIYYRYVYEDPTDAGSAVVDAASCWQLKDGDRPGDGVTAPNGAYDGTYTQDYEFVGGGSCLLDECNGRSGITPDYPNGTYYYVMTDSYPVIPRCLTGVADYSFTIGPPNFGCATSTAEANCTLASINEDPDALRSNITLRPMPAHDQLIIDLADQHLLDHVQGITVIDASGKVVLSSTTPILNTNGLAAGAYFVKIDLGSEAIMKAFIKE